VSFRIPTAAGEDEMQIVYVMEVIDHLERPNSARYVRRFTYETREQAWAKYTEAIRFGFEAYVEEVGRMPVKTQTVAHEHSERSSVAAWRAPRGSAVREQRRGGQRRDASGGDAFAPPGSA
jgi:hypothetical protein